MKKRKRKAIGAIKQLLQEQRGEGYFDVVIGILCLMLVVAFGISFLPIFQKKQQLDLFATELVRDEYYKNHTVQLNHEIRVLVTEQVKIGMFGFRSFPIEIQAKAIGHSEVYYK